MCPRWFEKHRRAAGGAVFALAAALLLGLTPAGADSGPPCSPLASAAALYEVQSNAPEELVLPALACLGQSAERGAIDRLLLDAVTRRLLAAEGQEGVFPYKIKQDLAFAKSVFEVVDRWPATEDGLRLGGTALRAKA